MKPHCSKYITHSLHQEMYVKSPENFHLLPSLLSPQTSYPFIGLCCSLPSNQLANWEFTTVLKRKLRIPLFPPDSTPLCACGTPLDPFGDHVFKCTRICKIGTHSFICNGFARALTPALTTAGFILPNSTADVEPQLCLLSNPHTCPFDISFIPYPTLPPNAHHGCTYTTISADITIGSLPPIPSIDHTSPDVIKTIAANDDSHLQSYKRRKLGQVNKRDPTTSIITSGNKVIGDLLARQMLLLPIAIDPLGQFGPLLDHFLFGSHRPPPILFPLSKPSAMLMYSKLLHYPSPKGVLCITDHNWLASPTRRFYNHSYLAPTPSISTIQKLGLCITKAFTHHARYATWKFIAHPAHTLPPNVLNPSYPGQ
jgi:hypothetical protein